MIPVQTTLSLSAQQSICPEAWNKQQATVQPHRQHTTQRQRSRENFLSFQQRGQHTRNVVIPVNRIMDSRQIISSSSRIPRTAHPSLRITILLFLASPHGNLRPARDPAAQRVLGSARGSPVGGAQHQTTRVRVLNGWAAFLLRLSLLFPSRSRLAVCPSSSCLTLNDNRNFDRGGREKGQGSRSQEMQADDSFTIAAQGTGRA